MRPMETPDTNCIFAKDHPVYDALPVHRLAGDPREGVIITWKLTWRERIKLLLTGKLWQHITTFGQPMQPQLHFVDNPFDWVNPKSETDPNMEPEIAPSPPARRPNPIWAMLGAAVIVITAILCSGCTSSGDVVVVKIIEAPEIPGDASPGERVDLERVLARTPWRR